MALGKSLRDDYDKINSPLVPQPQNVAASMGKTSVSTPAVRGLGDIMAPASNAASSPAPVDPNTTGATGAPDFEAKVAKNESWLADPGVQSSLLDFAIQVMSPGLTTEQQLEKRKVDLQESNMLFDNKMAQANYGLNVQNLQINQLEAQDKLLKNEQARQTLERRKQLFGAVKVGGQTALETMAPMDMVDMAGELVAMGDSEGAKVVLDMYKAKSGDTTPQWTNYQHARLQEGAAVGTFSQWMQAQSRATVPPAATAGVSTPMQEASIKMSDKADMLLNQVADLEQTRELAKVTPTGKTVPLTIGIRAAFQDFGFTFAGDKNDVDLQQTLLGRMNALALRMRNPDSGYGLTGNTSDRDVQFLQSIVGGLGDTPQANYAILTGMLAKQRREADIMGKKAEYIIENGTTKGWSKYIQGYLKDKPMFTDQEHVELEKMINPLRPAPGEESGPAKITQLPAAAPDTLSEEDKRLWSKYDDRMKRAVLGWPEPGAQ